MNDTEDLPDRQQDDPRFPSAWFPAVQEARAANNKPLTVWDVFVWQSTPLSLAAMATLLSPTFIEVRGCGLRADQYWPESFAGFWRELNGDRRRIEAVLNQEHVSDLYLNSTPVRDPRFDAAFAAVIGRCWRAALLEAFPDRCFQVEVTGSDDCEVTFWAM